MEYLVWLSNTAFLTWVRETPSVWGYPTVLTLHTVGLALLVGFMAAIDLRILGVAREAPLAPMEQLFPLVWIGFAINAVSGTLLFLLDPAKSSDIIFLIKMTLVAIGVVLSRLTQLHVFRRPGDLGAAQVPTKGRVLALASLVVWMGAVAAGRLMAYFAKSPLDK